MKDLKGKLVLITGAGCGIGRIMARKFAEEGSRLVLWDINQETMDKSAEIIKDTGGDVFTYICDVSKREAVYETAEKVKKEAGKVDVLVNNAGIVSGKSLLDLADEEIMKTIDVNVMAHFWMVKSFLPAMIEENSGHIVTIASSAGWVGVNALADYCASKFANVGFDESLRMELRKKKLTGIKTTCVCPYYIDTGMFEGVKTRFSFLLPILKEEEVAEQILEAVKKDKAILKMPPFTYTVPLLRLLPTPVMDTLADILGVSSSMDEFKGRKTGV